MTDTHIWNIPNMGQPRQERRITLGECFIQTCSNYFTITIAYYAYPNLMLLDMFNSCFGRSNIDIEQIY